MTVDLLVRVQHAPHRTEPLARLLPLLDGLRVEVVDDPDPSSRRARPWRTYRECLVREWKGTHLLIIQDDTVPVGHFGEAALAAIAARPENIVSFFLTHIPSRAVRAARRAHHQHQHWAPLHPQDFLPVVATVYPRAAVLAFAEWQERNVSRQQTGDDGVAGKFVAAHDWDGYVTVPSLVEHPDDVRSTLSWRSPHHRQPRRAIILEPDIDARTIDWSVPNPSD